MKKTVIFSLVGIFILFAIINAECGSSSSSDDKRTFTEVVRDGDFEAAHKWLNNSYDYYRRNPDPFYENDQSYWSKAFELYTTEFNVLLKANDLEANERLLEELQNMNTLGFLQNVSTNKEYDRNYQEGVIYVEYVKNYNKLCDRILDAAIHYKNKDMARKIIKMYEEDGQYIRNFDKKEYKIIPLGYKSRDKAQKELDRAIKEGEFNE